MIPNLSRLKVGDSEPTSAPSSRDLVLAQKEALEEQAGVSDKIQRKGPWTWQTPAEALQQATTEAAIVIRSDTNTQFTTGVGLTISNAQRSEVEFWQELEVDPYMELERDIMRMCLINYYPDLGSAIYPPPSRRRALNTPEISTVHSSPAVNRMVAMQKMSALQLRRKSAHKTVIFDARLRPVFGRSSEYYTKQAEELWSVNYRQRWAFGNPFLGVQCTYSDMVTMSLLVEIDHTVPDTVMDELNRLNSDVTINFQRERMAMNNLLADQFRTGHFLDPFASVVIRPHMFVFATGVMPPGQERRVRMLPKPVPPNLGVPTRQQADAQEGNLRLGSLELMQKIQQPLLDFRGRNLTMHQRMQHVAERMKGVLFDNGVPARGFREPMDWFAATTWPDITLFRVAGDTTPRIGELESAAMVLLAAAYWQKQQTRMEMLLKANLEAMYAIFSSDEFKAEQLDGHDAFARCRKMMESTLRRRETDDMVEHPPADPGGPIRKIRRAVYDFDADECVRKLRRCFLAKGETEGETEYLDYEAMRHMMLWLYDDFEKVDFLLKFAGVSDVFSELGDIDERLNRLLVRVEADTVPFEEREQSIFDVVRGYDFEPMKKIVQGETAVGKIMKDKGSDFVPFVDEMRGFFQGMSTTGGHIVGMYVGGDASDMAERSIAFQSVFLLTNFLKFRLTVVVGAEILQHSDHKGGKYHQVQMRDYERTEEENQMASALDAWQNATKD